MMLAFLSRLRRAWFPTDYEQFSDGTRFAQEHFAGCETEAEADMLYEALPLEPGDSFDNGVRAHYRVLCAKLRKQE